MDFIVNEYKQEDMLSHMFEKQKEFQTRLGTYEKIGSDPAKLQQFMNQMILACHEEVTEIMRETAYKNPDFVPFGWKKTQTCNFDKMKEEIVDLFHFLMNLAIASGMDAKEFYEIYCKKNGINFERQENGY